MSASWNVTQPRKEARRERRSCLAGSPGHRAEWENQGWPLHDAIHPTSNSYRDEEKNPVVPRVRDDEERYSRDRKGVAREKSLWSWNGSERWLRGWLHESACDRMMSPHTVPMPISRFPECLSLTTRYSPGETSWSVRGTSLHYLYDFLWI